LSATVAYRGYKIDCLERLVYDELSYVECGVKLCSLTPVLEIFWQQNCSDSDISCNACQYHDMPQRLMMSVFTDISEM